MKTFRLQIAASLKSIPAVHRFIESSARDLAIGGDALYDLRLAAEEAITNTIKHGYSGQAGTIQVELAREGTTGVIRLWDDAKVFDPTVPVSTDFSRPLLERPSGGMGLCLLRESIDEIRHEVTKSGGNHLIMKKSLR